MGLSDLFKKDEERMVPVEVLDRQIALLSRNMILVIESKEFGRFKVLVGKKSQGSMLYPGDLIRWQFRRRPGGSWEPASRA